MTMIKTGQLVALVLAGVLGSTAAWAHHSFAGFDFTKTMTLNGTVTEFQWTNPHMFIKLMAPNANGQIVQWSIESGTPNINARNGWKKSDIKPGDKITVEIHPMRDKSPGGTLMHVKLSDGRTLYGTGNDFVTAPPPKGAPKSE